MTQEKQILEHLQKHGSITSYEAFELYGATRLSAVIYNLRHNRGLRIITESKAVQTRYGHGTLIAVYKLVENRG